MNLGLFRVLLWILAAIGEGVFSFREPSLKTGGHICLGQKKKKKDAHLYVLIFKTENIWMPDSLNDS